MTTTRRSNPRQREREKTFEVVDDCLVRTVFPRSVECCQHRCTWNAFEQVAHGIDEAGDEGLVEHESLPFTQVAVALAFLRKRGLVEMRRRRNYAATVCADLDAMTEFYASAENY